MSPSDVQAEQSLQTDVECDWLYQFWVQGRVHAALHPWWRAPMACLVAAWCLLDARSAAVVDSAISKASKLAKLPHSPELVRHRKLIESLIRSLEERSRQRGLWAARFADKSYLSLAPEHRPVFPLELFSHTTSVGLSQDLSGTMQSLRGALRKLATAKGVGVAASASDVVAGAKTNWQALLLGGGSKRSSDGPTSASKVGGRGSHRKGPRKAAEKRGFRK